MARTEVSPTTSEKSCADQTILSKWAHAFYTLLIKSHPSTVCVVPGMPTDTVSACMDTLAMLTRSKKKISIDDLRLPWKPIYDILSRDLFLKRRQFEYKYATHSDMNR
jgi:hypothetical protein